MTTAVSKSNESRFQIRFRSSFLDGRTEAFPCDAQGHVDMDRLSNAKRLDYLFARIMIRRECAVPEIVRSPAKAAASR